ncbi:MAG TPA: DUF1097 domain-containing protein [Gemmatimonadales bacterium]|nr:DUF1097 domain-containing protein [Gemmatimonadales bacterium]
MNTMTTRALILGLLVAVWTWVAGAARLHVSIWAGFVALGCFLVAGGGVPALQKTALAAVSGVVWVLMAQAVAPAIGGGSVVHAVVLGATATALVLQSRLPLLSFTPAAFGGAGVAYGLGVSTLQGGVRAAIGLVAGAVLGFAAERLVDAVGAPRA